MIDTKWTPELAEGGPRYRALADEIAAAITEGRLTPGERLPPVRDLAWTLKVTPGTVARAYQLAEGRGLLRGEVGRGTFVLGPVAAETRSLFPSAYLAPAAPGLIDLRLNRAPDIGQNRAITATLERLIADRGGALPLTATTRFGEDLPERSAAVDWLAEQGVDAALEDLVLTSGAQPAVLTAMLATAGGVDAVVVTEPLVHPGLKDLARAINVRLEAAEADREGLTPDSLDAACARARPAAVLLTANDHNPTLTTMSLARREAIAEVCRRRGIAIIEDDIYGPLAARRPPSFRALAPERCWYVAGLSKSVAAGLRIGFLATPPGEGLRGARIMQSCTQHVSWLNAGLTAELIRSGVASEIVTQVRAEVRRRVEQVRRSFQEVGVGAEALTTSDTASIVYLRLPDPWRASDFAQAAEAAGVALRSSEMFVVGRAPAPHAVRLGLGQVESVELLAEAARRCGDILERGPSPTDAPA